MFFDSIVPTGKLIISVIRENGLTEEIAVNNLVVSAGKTTLASWLAGNGPNVFSHMALGSGNTASALSDISLAAQLARVAIGTKVASDNTVTYTATFGPGVATGSVKEAGIFNNVSAGNMLCRTVFPEVVKGALDTIIINWSIAIN